MLPSPLRITFWTALTKHSEEIFISNQLYERPYKLLIGVKVNRDMRIHEDS